MTYGSFALTIDIVIATARDDYTYREPGSYLAIFDAEGKWWLCSRQS